MRSIKRSRVSRRAILQASLGIVIVGISIAGVALLLERSGVTRTVGVALDDASAGTRAGNLKVEFLEVPYDLVEIPSLTTQEWGSLSDMVVNRSLRAGDVLSVRDFSFVENRDLTAISLDLSMGEPFWLSAGQRVVLWVAPPVSENAYSAPFVLSGNAVIESVSRDEGFASDGVLRQVSILVSSRDVPGVINALANRYFLYLVPEP
jgi:hypothetical protein